MTLEEIARYHDGAQKGFRDLSTGALELGLNRDAARWRQNSDFHKDAAALCRKAERGDAVKVEAVTLRRKQQ